MSYIRFRSTENYLFWNGYKSVLQRKITAVCSRIGFDDSKVIWEIFDSFVEYADGRRKPTNINKMFVGIKTNGADYAATDVKNRVVYVSLMAIRLDRSFVGIPIVSGALPLYSGLGFGRIRKYEDKLANILIDEFTHLQTKENHGNEKYDKQLAKNIELYYDGSLSIVDRLLYRKSR